MSGRPIAAAPWVFVEFIRMPHTGMSAPRKTVFLADIKSTAQKVANGDAVNYLEADVRLARGRGGGEYAPRSHNNGSFIFRRRVFANPSSSVAQTVEEPFLWRVTARGRPTCAQHSAPCVFRLLNFRCIKRILRVTDGISTGARRFRVPPNL